MKNIVFRNRLIVTCMLAILVFGQFALAAHATVHYDHISHKDIAQTKDTPHPSSEGIQHLCPECLLTHAFSVSDLPAVYYHPEIRYVKHTHLTRISVFQNRIFYAYDATGPPTISI